MQITITNVLKDEVTVSGQTLRREYVENIMLPMLVAQCATVQSRKLEIVKVFAEAGLSLNAVPEAAREYAVDKSEKARLRLRQQAEANAHAERCRVWSTDHHHGRPHCQLRSSQELGQPDHLEGSRPGWVCDLH